MSTQSKPICPDICVPLSGEDGNAFFIIGRVSSAMKRGGIPGKVIDEFTNEAMSGDYDNVLRTCMKYVETT